VQTRAILAALHGIRLPRRPRDGSGVRCARAITNRLTAAGFDARTASVICWADREKKAISVMHQVTVVGDWMVVDGTAGRFNPAWSGLWITDRPSYVDGLTRHLMVPTVTLSPPWPPSDTVPPASPTG
jgi:hypothetical protein